MKKSMAKALFALFFLMTAAALLLPARTQAATTAYKPLEDGIDWGMEVDGKIFYLDGADLMVGNGTGGKQTAIVTSDDTTHYGSFYANKNYVFFVKSVGDYQSDSMTYSLMRYAIKTGKLTTFVEIGSGPIIPIIDAIAGGKIYLNAANETSYETVVDVKTAELSAFADDYAVVYTAGSYLYCAHIDEESSTVDKVRVYNMKTQKFVKTWKVAAGNDIGFSSYADYLYRAVTKKNGTIVVYESTLAGKNQKKIYSGKGEVRYIWGRCLMVLEKGDEGYTLTRYNAANGIRDVCSYTLTEYAAKNLTFYDTSSCGFALKSGKKVKYYNYSFDVDEAVEISKEEFMSSY